MPLARIITHSSEAAAKVSKQLKARGYTVETVSPGESCEKRADLEIVLETARSDNALSRATELAQTTGANVYIGAAAFRARRIDVPDTAVPASSRGGLRTPTVEDTVNGVAAGLQNKRDLLAKALWEQRANMREARHLQRERVRQEQARVAAETDRLRAREEDLARVRAAAEDESLRIAGLVARQEAERAEHERAEATERERIAAERAEAERLVREEERLTQEPLLLGLNAAEVEGAAPAGHELPHRLEGEIAATEESVNAQVVGIRDSADKTASEEAALRSAAPSQPIAEPAQLPQPVVAASRQENSHRVRLRLPGKRYSDRRPMRPRTREWRAAIIVSSIFALVLMLAWRAATRGPVSPLPTAVTNSNLQQEVPFGAVTLAPPNGDVSGALAPASGSERATPRPVPANLHGRSVVSNGAGSAEGAVAQHTAEGQPKASAQTVRKSKPSAVRQRRPADTDVAEDEVIIRHFNTSKSAQPAGTQKASLKKYSDLD